MKSLSNLSHFAIFDLTKIGAAYQVINSFVDDETILAFEICPLGSQAVLMLSSKDLIALQFVYNQCLTLHKSDILNSICIENLAPGILDAYLSQNKPQVAGSILIAESESFATAFGFAHKLAAQQVSLLDFRVVRTSPPNLIITATGSTVVLKEFVTSDSVIRTTLIDQVQKPLQAYFEILN